MSDKLNDPAFASRLAKLLPMLGSEQVEEADVARRKLIEHLRGQGLSLNDLAVRIQRQMVISAPAQTNPRASDSERQIHMLRTMLAETQAELISSKGVSAELQRAVDRTAVLANRLSRARDQARIVAIAAVVVAGGSLMLNFGPYVHGWVQGQPPRATGGMPPFMQSGDEAARSALLPPGPGEIYGTAAVQDMAVRYDPHTDAGVRAYLNRGTPVVISRTLHSGDQTWLFVRSASGMGWAISGDVLR